jgi:hypothetical protein
MVDPTHRPRPEVLTLLSARINSKYAATQNERI